MQLDEGIAKIKGCNFFAPQCIQREENEPKRQ